MNWLSFVNGLVGVVLILSVAVLGLSQLAAAFLLVSGVIVLVCSSLRWITGFSRYTGGGDRLMPAR